MATNFNKQVYANNATSTLAYAVDASSTTLTVADGARFPTPQENEYFTLTLGSGSVFEIVEVYGRSGNVLSQCVRGAQGTTATSFPAGTLVENRLTAGSISEFARAQDRLAPMSYLTDLVKPESINNNSVLLIDSDDAGNPIVAVEYAGRWRFVSHPLLLVDQEIYDPVAQATTTSLQYTSLVDISSVLVERGFIVQAVSGLNRGYSRFVTSATSSYVSWTTPFPHPFSYGDRVHIYRSTSSAIQWLVQQVELSLGGQSTQQSLIQEEIYKTAYKAPAVAATTANITLSGLQTVDGVLLQNGDRVLVKNQTVSALNGVYVASSAGWARSIDANDSVKVQASMIVPVVYGTTNADTFWTLDSSGPITLGSTALPFKDLHSGYAKLASPLFTGVPSAPTAAVGTNTTQLATTAFVLAQAASANPAMNGAAAPGTSLRWSREDHVHPSDSSRAPIDSPAFTGNPVAPTRVQFDNSTSLATTAFVQRALGSSAGYIEYSGNTVLTPADVGRLVRFVSTGASQTIYLPEIASLPNGATITILGGGNDCMTVASTNQGGDWITVDPKYAYDALSQKIYLMPPESVTLTLFKTGQTGGYPTVTARWIVSAGSLSLGAPVGSISYNAGNIAPFGHLRANGALVSRTTYARLYNIIGTMYGAGDGLTTFQLPDLRGEFLRGWDDGRGVDPGRSFASSQSSRMQDHYHGTGDFRRESNDDWYSIIRDWVGSFTGRRITGDAGTNNTTNLTGGSGGTRYTGTTDQILVAGTETRPRNVALLACIKY